MSHTQLLYHVVFSTKNRSKVLTEQISDKVYAYIAGVCQELDGYALLVNGHLDHVHMLVRIPTTKTVASWIGQVKANTSKHINEKRWVIGKFHWQDGYGAFTVSVSAKDAVYDYIAKQKEHHAKGTFEQEYLMLLNKHEIEYDPEYVFD